MKFYQLNDNLFNIDKICTIKQMFGKDCNAPTIDRGVIFLVITLDNGEFFRLKMDGLAAKDFLSYMKQNGYL